jgi:hypothetical protein
MLRVLLEIIIKIKAKATPAYPAVNCKNRKLDRSEYNNQNRIKKVLFCLKQQFKMNVFNVGFAPKPHF